MMQIIHVATPGFTFEGEELTCRSQRYLDFADFQKEIEKKKSEGATKCFLYSMYTQTDPNYPAPDYMLLWVRYLFYKPVSVTIDNIDKLTMDNLDKFLLELSMIKNVGIRRKIIVLERYLKEITERK